MTELKSTHKVAIHKKGLANKKEQNTKEMLFYTDFQFLQN